MSKVCLTYLGPTLRAVFLLLLLVACTSSLAAASLTEEPPLSCDDSSPVTLIDTVQGPGLSSTLVGQRVVVDGVVVGDFQENDQPDHGDLGGFFLQEEVDGDDGDQATSSGIFVLESGTTDVAVGDHLRLRGTVAEQPAGSGSRTQLEEVEIALCVEAAAAPPPVALLLPQTTATDFEAVEGMVVSFSQELTIAGVQRYAADNALLLTLGRQMQPTAVELPGSPAAANLAQENALGRVWLDDGREQSYPDPTRHPDGQQFTLEHRFRAGDTLSNLLGIMDEGPLGYRVQPLSGATYAAVDLRPPPPGHPGGDLVTVAVFDLDNYFITPGEAGDVCGPTLDLPCLGAQTAADFARQRTKIIAAIMDVDADIVALLNIENAPAEETDPTDPNDPVVQDLIDGLNAAYGVEDTYEYLRSEPVGAAARKVAIILKPALVFPLTDDAVLDSTVDPRFDDVANLPAYTYTFIQNELGGVFTLAVAQFAPRTDSSCGVPGDLDIGDGQGACNQTRTAAAAALVDWMDIDPTISCDFDILIVGDLNAYKNEDPLAAIVAGPDDTPATADDYTNLLADDPVEPAYNRIDDGLYGHRIHALASPTLVSQVVSAATWHSNAAEPDILGYDSSAKQPPQAALFAPDAYRAAVADPLVITLRPAATQIQLCTAFVQGQVALQGRSSPGSAGTVTMVDTEGIYEPQEVSFNALNGLFIYPQFYVQRDGSSFRFEAAHDIYLSNVHEPVLIMPGGSLSLPRTTLSGGDATNDQAVNILDLGCIGGSYLAGVSTCGGRGSSDLNGDGSTSILDLSMCGSNFLATGFQPW